MKLPMVFFWPAGLSQAAVCPTTAVDSHVFSSVDVGMFITTKKANAGSEQPTCFNLISQWPVFFQNMPFENVIMLVIN